MGSPFGDSVPDAGSSLGTQPDRPGWAPSFCLSAPPSGALNPGVTWLLVTSGVSVCEGELGACTPAEHSVSEDKGTLPRRPVLGRAVGGAWVSCQVELGTRSTSPVPRPLGLSASAAQGTQAAVTAAAAWVPGRRCSLPTAWGPGLVRRPGAGRSAVR